MIAAEGGMNSGRKLMDEARRIKNAESTLDAADYLQANGINYDLAMIALVGLNRYREEYGSNLKTCWQE